MTIFSTTFDVALSKKYANFEVLKSNETIYLAGDFLRLRVKRVLHNVNFPVLCHMIFSLVYIYAKLKKDLSFMELLDEYDNVADEWVVSEKGSALLQQGYTRYCCFNNVDVKPAIPVHC